MGELRRVEEARAFETFVALGIGGIGRGEVDGGGDAGARQIVRAKADAGLPLMKAAVDGRAPVLRRKAEAAAEPSGYVYEEMAEIELARENETAARPWFAKAYAALSAEPWLQANESARLERLRQRGGVQ